MAYRDFGTSFLDALTETLVPSLAQSLHEGLARQRQESALSDLMKASAPTVTYPSAPSGEQTFRPQLAYAGAVRQANEQIGPTLAGTPGQRMLTPGQVQPIRQVEASPLAQGVQRTETPVDPNDPRFVEAYMKLAGINPGLAEQYMTLQQMNQPFYKQEGTPSTGITQLRIDRRTGKAIGTPEELTKPTAKPFKVQYIDKAGNQRVAEFTPEQIAAQGGVVTLPEGTLQGAKEQRTAQTAATGGLDPQTIDYYAGLVAIDPKNMPSFGFGAAAQKSRVDILNAAAKKSGNDPTGVLVRRQALAANNAALTQTTKSKAAVSTFEKTGRKNLQNFLVTAQNIIDTGSPWINTPLRDVDVNALGSPEVAAYNTARRVAINEIAKVLSNPNLTGALSDAARQEVESFNPAGATLAQTYAVADILNRDMENRIQAIEETEKGLRDQVRELSTVGIATKQKKVVRTGTFNGRKVVQYDDGTTEYQK